MPSGACRDRQENNSAIRPSNCCWQSRTLPYRSRGSRAARRLSLPPAHRAPTLGARINREGHSLRFLVSSRPDSGRGEDHVHAGGAQNPRAVYASTIQEHEDQPSCARGKRLKRRPFPLALLYPGSNPGWSSRNLSYSQVNESRGQVKALGTI